ncbi:MAG: helix-turn-helix domain-containing protein [Magnetococcales bacterium]|nr:helix-turn-helix domain-containing protein [Magnetococcales bacterium]
MNAEEKIIKNKIGLLSLAEILGSVLRACKVMGYSRDNFYRLKSLYGKGGERALQEISCQKPILKNRVDPEVERAVVGMATDFPAYGQLRVSNKLNNKVISVPFCYGTIWKFSRSVSRHWMLRLHQEGGILTEEQLKMLGKAKEGHGEIDTEHPSYLGAQDIYYVGTNKGCKGSPRFRPRSCSRSRGVWMVWPPNRSWISRSRSLMFH